MSRPGLDHAVVSRVDQLTCDAVASGDVPGVVAAVARAEGSHVSWAGMASFSGPPMARDTVFRISSISKPIIAAAILSLVDNGILALEEPVDRLLPELADRRVLRHPDSTLTDTVAARRPVTVADLLTFTWGFGMQGAMFLTPKPWPIVAAAHERRLMTFGPAQPANTPDPDTWMAGLAELPLLAQPGDRWLYHTGSQVLGVLAARAMAAPLEEVLRKQLLDPLQMSDTRFHTTEISRLAAAYERVQGELLLTDPPDGQWATAPAFPDGAGGLLSTVDDLTAFGRMLLRGGQGVLRPETVAEMTRNQLTAEQRGNVWPGFSFLGDRGWGYGVSILDDGRYTWEGGLGTAWSNVPHQDLTVVVLTQRAADAAGMPAVCDAVLYAARASLS